MSRILRRTILLLALGIFVLAAGSRPLLAAGRASRSTGDNAIPVASLTLLWQERAEGREDGHEGLYKVINFLILAGGLGYLLRKPLAEFFEQRSASIKRSLDEGRSALAASQSRLEAVEEQLRRLEDEIAAFKADATREMEAERERLQQATTREAEKMMEFARTRIEAATRAAKVELKTHAARQAVELAEPVIRERLDDATRGRLVARFVEGLQGSPRTES